MACLKSWSNWPSYLSYLESLAGPFQVVYCVNKRLCGSKSQRKEFIGFTIWQNNNKYINI